MTMFVGGFVAIMAAAVAVLCGVRGAMRCFVLVLSLRMVQPLCSNACDACLVVGTCGCNQGRKIDVPHTGVVMSGFHWLQAYELDKVLQVFEIFAI